ncbi:hypothetical protein [Cellulomonas sp. S1-8]|uniref:hypothetical protein n=1 Tax=Cellulomonas sp. S1-8 TaxID=2904790 RepID=UPI0022431E63|nr:hypothetical protein [Cellulomonas sp. S1-8]UZN04187.1 hypothetical protein OKX07_04410 [Cellulomonas sp. S1-8]
MRSSTRGAGSGATGERGRAAGALLVVGVAAALLGTVVAPSSASSASSAEPEGASQLDGGHRGGRTPHPVDLGVPGETSDVVAVSDSGVVIGSYSDDGVHTRAFRWREGVIDVMPGLTSSRPEDVNDAGQVVINGRYGDEPLRPFLWQPDGTVVDLLGPGGVGNPGGINSRGDVALTVQVPGQDGQHYAAVWQDGVLHRLAPPEIAFSVVADAPAINDRGEVTGIAMVGTTQTAFVWRDGAMHLMDTPDGGYTLGAAINERGQVYVGTPDGMVVWEPDGRVGPAVAEFGAMAFGDRGGAVGFVSPAPTFRPVPAVLDRRGVTLLPTLGGPDGQVYGTNGRGMHVGWSATAQGELLPTAWVRGRAVALGGRLRGVGTASEGWARDVDARGRAVGMLHFAPGGEDYVERAVLWELGRHP